jgi:ABC-type spermidine/putrescine transport system permease subunit I
MRHNRVIARRGHRRAFRRAFLTAAIATAAAAVLGYAIAFSPLAEWVTMGLAAAVAATFWVESRSGRAADAPPVTRIFLGQQGNN